MRRAGFDALPSGWSLESLASLVDSSRPIAYGVVKPGEPDPSGVKLIRGGDVNGGSVRAKLRTISNGVSAQYKRTLLRGGELIVSLVGFPGQAAIVPKRLAGANLARQVGLVAIPDVWLTRFVHQYIQSHLGQSVILHPLAGSAQQVINLEDLRRMPVVLPPADERICIALVGRSFDKILRYIGRIIRTREELKRALLQQLLTGRRRFPEFRKQTWVEHRIGDLFEEVSRPIAWDDSKLYDLISIRRRSAGLFLRGRLYGHQIKTKQLFEVRSGDFLISKMQVVRGALGLVTNEFDGMKVSGSYVSLRPRKNAPIAVGYFDYLTHLPAMYHAVLLSCYGVHIEKMTFNLEWYLRTRIRVPPTMDEQHKIAGILDNCNRELQLLALMKSAFANQKKGLMQKLITGEVRVPATMLRECDRA